MMASSLSDSGDLATSQCMGFLMGGTFPMPRFRERVEELFLLSGMLEEILINWQGLPFFLPLPGGPEGLNG